MKKPTTSDIAKLAGVSQSTVSMILTGRSDVTFSEETIGKVFLAAKQLNYTATRKKKSGILNNKFIAVVSPTLANPYYSTLIQSSENQAVNNGYSTAIFNTSRDPQIEENYLNFFSQFPFKGIIFTSMPFHQEHVKVLSLNIPVVIISDKSEYMEEDTIEINSIEAGTLIAEHLLELGHKKIAYITTPLATCSTQRRKRLEGVQKSLKNSDAELTIFESKENTALCKYNLNEEYSAGYKLTQEAMKDTSITAYIGVNDMVSFGIIDALDSAKIHIPEDVSVCGFDNIFPSQFQRISLTTVDSFLIEKGRDAFDLLLRKIKKNIEDKDINEIYRIEYKTKLIIRNSTGERSNS